jgi:sulfate transport system substrate-binding protein
MSGSPGEARKGYLLRKPKFHRAFPIYATLLVLTLFGSSCLPKPPAETGGLNITLYAFSIMKEAMEKAIYPGFVAKWKLEHGQDVRFTSSYAGSETVTNQIISGVPADIAILSIDRDAQRLKEKGFVTSDWHALPYKGIINKTPFVILVKGANPKNIHDFPDLGKPGVKLIHPDPVSSGGAQWSILAIYGSELVKSEKQNGEPDQARALQTLQAVWKNVFVTPASAREARTTFELGNGDALVTYELEGLLMKESGKPLEIITPPATIFSEHPVVVIDRNVSPEKRPVVNAFVQYLWTEEAQRAFVKYHFYSVTDDALNEASKEFGHIEWPFSIDYFGGWDRAYPEIIEQIFKNKVQSRK